MAASGDMRDLRDVCARALSGFRPETRPVSSARDEPQHLLTHLQSNLALAKNCRSVIQKILEVRGINHENIGSLRQGLKALHCSCRAVSQLPPQLLQGSKVMQEAHGPCRRELLLENMLREELEQAAGKLAQHLSGVKWCQVSSRPS